MPRFLDPFYSTPHDLGDALRAVESVLNIDYVEDGLLSEPLVVLADTPITPKPIPQRHGGIRYEVGPSECPGHMIFSPGGKYGDGVLISGQLGLSYFEDDVSREIYSVFQSHFFAKFSKKLHHWIGPEAMDLWKAGARLTQDVGRSREFDLRWPSQE